MYIGKKSKNPMQSSVLARAAVKGSKEHPSLRGTVTLKQMKNGVLVTAEVYGLPYDEKGNKGGVFGFHIHEGTQCSGNEKDPFADAKMHFNPKGNPHPYHAGDMPPLFGNKGYAYMSFFTDRFQLKDVIGRVIIIHDSPDDFTTQPSGNSGTKIACGKIFSL